MTTVIHKPSTRAPDNFPRWVLMCAGGVIAFSLISVGLVRLTGNGPDQKPAPGTMERALRFEDRPDGSIAVIDGRTGELVRSFKASRDFCAARCVRWRASASPAASARNCRSS